MSLHIQSDSMHYIEPIRTQPSYSFTDLQEIWMLQKILLEEFKSTEVPFIALDFENNGVLTAADFPDRFVQKGFPHNPSLYLLFFAFLDTDCDGYINKEDWIQGYKNIGVYLLETRALARDYLKTVKEDTQHQSHSMPVIPSQYTSPSNKYILSDQASIPKTWQSAKSFTTLRDEAYQNLQTTPKKASAPAVYIHSVPIQNQASPNVNEVKAQVKVVSQPKLLSVPGSVNSVQNGRVVENDVNRSVAEEKIKNKQRIENVSQNSLTSLRYAGTEPVEIKPNFDVQNPSQLRVEDVTYLSHSSLKKDNNNQTNVQDSIITNTQIPDPIEIKMEEHGVKQYEMRLDQILLRSQSSFKGGNGTSIQDSEIGDRKGFNESVANKSGVPTKQNPSLASIEASLIAKKEEGGSGNSSERSRKNSEKEKSKFSNNNEILKDMETKTGNEDAMEAILGVLDSERQRQKLNQFIENRRDEYSRVTVPENSNGRGGYAPSVTSIAAADEESIMQNNSKKGVKSMGALENNLTVKVGKSKVRSSHELYVHRASEDQGRLPSDNPANNKSEGASNKGLKTASLSRKEPSPSGSRISLISRSAASQLLGLNSRQDEQIPYQLSDERRGNHRSIVIHNAEMSPTELGTPSWKEPVRNFTETTEQEEDLFLMVERMLEGHGGLEEALRMLQKEDLSRFPHIQMLVKGLENQVETERNMYNDEEERGRGVMPPVRKRSQTKSLVEVRVRGDLSMEIEEDLQRRRRALTPEISLVHSTGRFRKDSQSLRGSRNILDSLKELDRLKPQEARGTEGALEVLEKREEERRRKSSASERSRSRSERKSFLDKDGSQKERVTVEIPEPRKYGEAKKMCKEITDMFKEDKKQKKKDDGEGIWNSVGYRIRSDEIVGVRKERPGRGLLWGDRRSYGEDDGDNKSRLKNLIDQLSQETAGLESRINYHRLSEQPRHTGEARHRRELFVETNTSDRDRGLWGMFRGNGEEKNQVRTPVKTFLRGSVTSDFVERDSVLNLSQEQQHVQEQIEKKISSPRLLDKYSRIVADLGSLGLRVDKRETQRTKSPLAAVKNSRELAVNLSIEEEFTGRGKTYLLSQMTRNNIVNKEFIQANKSLRNAGW